MAARLLALAGLILGLILLAPATLVAEPIRVARSLTAVVTWTAGAALSSGLLGVGIYVILRVLPIRALERSEGSLLAIMDSAPDAFLMLDPTGRITLSNASAATLFGLSSSEMAGRHLSELIKTSDRPGLEAVIERFRGAASSPRDTAEAMELTGLNPQQDDFPAEARFSASRTDTGTSIVCVLRDVTDRKKAEAALDESREQSVTLLTVSRQVSGMLDITEMMRRVARETGLALGADMVGVFLADPQQATLRAIAGYHVPKPLLDDLATPIPLKGDRLLEEAWEQRRAVAVSDAASDPRMDEAFLRRLPHRSSLFCPMVVQREPIEASSPSGSSTSIDSPRPSCDWSKGSAVRRASPSPTPVSSPRCRLARPASRRCSASGESYRAFSRWSLC